MDVLNPGGTNSSSSSGSTGGPPPPGPSLMGAMMSGPLNLSQEPSLSLNNHQVCEATCMYICAVCDISKYQVGPGTKHCLLYVF